MLVTFDLFSALIDSRTGGSAVFGRLAAERGWPVTGEQLYDAWDAANKASQRDLAGWVPFAEHSRRALVTAYAALGLDADAGADTAVVLGSVGEWPLWPDVPEGLPAIGRRWRVGILSNVDDDVLARTRVGALVEAGVVDDGAVLTSERLRAYKPSPLIYRRAAERAGGRVVHVATSARDVRGALEAGLPVVRLVRPGHRLDPGGPRPSVEAAHLAGLEEALGQMGAGDDDLGRT